MFLNLKLSRPLAVLDTETTGKDPRTARVVELALRLRGDGLDVGGVFVQENGAATFAVGKYRGTPLATVAVRDPGYLRWFLDKGDFLDDAKGLVREVMGRAGG